ncbi:hypothetical protein MMC06_004839 [Schaereria dolodes]|nr:hypothetical protein [Schaereria dolodes]
MDLSTRGIDFCYWQSAVLDSDVCTRMYNRIPFEVLSSILSYLPKKSMKEARFVCKNWSELVVPSLYNKIVISPQVPNMKVFRYISQHEVYSKCVRELVYDMTWFQSNISFEEYEKELRRDQYKGEQVDLSDIDLQQGLVLHMEHALIQDRLLNDSRYLALMCIGLLNLTQLRMVTFSATWDESFSEEDYDKSVPLMLRLKRRSRGYGPLSRSWNYRHLAPTQSVSADASRGFFLVLRALSRTDTYRQIRTLRTLRCESFEDCILCPDIFCDPSPRVMENCRRAMLHLTEIYLDIDGSNDRKITRNISRLLGAAANLKRLRLTFVLYETSTPYEAVELAKLIGSHTWVHLQHLSLEGFATKQAELLDILERHSSSNLEAFVIRAITLTDGSWADILDQMRMRLNIVLSGF